MRQLSHGDLAAAFGRALRATREARGWTQAALAERVGLAVEAYGRLERGRVLPRAQTLVALARALDVTTDSLLGLRPAISRAGGAVGSFAAETGKEAGSPPPELNRLVRQLWTARPKTLRLLIQLVGALEK